MAREADIEACVALHPNAMGLILRKAASKSSNIDLLTLERAKTLARYIPKPIMSIMLTHEVNVHELVESIYVVEPDAVQIQTDLSLPDFETVKARLPHVPIVKKISIHVGRSIDNILSEVRTLANANCIDAFVLDTAATPGGRGGTGKAHDWSLSQSVVRSVPDSRFVLAGGLTSENVGRAVSEVNPFGVDVMSGISDAPGIKNLEKIRAFTSQLRANNPNS